MGEIVNKQRLANILGKSERWLTELQKEGMPVQENGKRGQSNRYDTAVVIAWMLARELEATTGKLSLHAQETRVAKHRADKLEHEVNLLKGNVVLADTVESTWKNLVIRMRTKLLAVPSRVAALCEGRTKIEIKQNIEEVIREALNELADTGDDGGADSSNAADSNEHPARAETTAENEPDRVGRQKKIPKRRSKRRTRKV